MTYDYRLPTDAFSVTFLGTREPSRISPEKLRAFQVAAHRCAEAGVIVCCGAAPGAEQLAAETALSAGGLVHLFLPWNHYEQDWAEAQLARYPGRVKITILSRRENAAWLEAARSYCPEARYYSAAVTDMFGRYYGMVSASKAVIALPMVRTRWVAKQKPKKRGWFAFGRSEDPELFPLEDRGHTGQVISLADFASCDVFDLSHLAAKEELERLFDDLAVSERVLASVA